MPSLFKTSFSATCWLIANIYGVRVEMIMAQQPNQPVSTTQEMLPPGSMPGIAPRPRPVNPLPVPTAFDPSKGYILSADDDRVLWTQHHIVEATKGHVAPSFFVRYLLEDFVGAGPRMIYEDIGGGWLTYDRGTILKDRTILLGGTLWLTPGQPPRKAEVTICDRSATILALFPDGAVVQPTAWGVLKELYEKIWWLPIKDHEFDYDSMSQLTDDVGVGMSQHVKVVRHQNRFAWIDMTRTSEVLDEPLRKSDRLYIYDLDSKQRDEIELPVVGRGTRVRHFDGRYAFTRVFLIDTKSRTVIKTPYVDPIGMHDAIAYTFAVDPRNSFDLVSIDLRNTEKRTALFKLDPAKFPTYLKVRPDLFEHERKELAQKANALAVEVSDGLRVWTGEQWAHVPWKRPE